MGANTNRISAPQASVRAAREDLYSFMSVTQFHHGHVDGGQRRHHEHRGRGDLLKIQITEIVVEIILNEIDRLGRIGPKQEIALPIQPEKADDIEHEEKFHMGQQLEEIDPAEKGELGRPLHGGSLGQLRVDPGSRGLQDQGADPRVFPQIQSKQHQPGVLLHHLGEAAEHAGDRHRGDDHRHRQNRQEIQRPRRVVQQVYDPQRQQDHAQGKDQHPDTGVPKGRLKGCGPQQLRPMPGLRDPILHRDADAVEQGIDKKDPHARRADREKGRAFPIPFHLPDVPPLFAEIEGELVHQGLVAVVKAVLPREIGVKQLLDAAAQGHVGDDRVGDPPRDGPQQGRVVLRQGLDGHGAHALGGSELLYRAFIDRQVHRRVIDRRCFVLAPIVGHRIVQDVFQQFKGPVRHLGVGIDAPKADDGRAQRLGIVQLVIGDHRHGAAHRFLEHGLIIADIVQKGIVLGKEGKVVRRTGKIVGIFVGELHRFVGIIIDQLDEPADGFQLLFVRQKSAAVLVKALHPRRVKKGIDRVGPEDVHRGGGPVGGAKERVRFCQERVVYIVRNRIPPLGQLRLGGESADKIVAEGDEILLPRQLACVHDGCGIGLAVQLPDKAVQGQEHPAVGQLPGIDLPLHPIVQHHIGAALGHELHIHLVKHGLVGLEMGDLHLVRSRLLLEVLHRLDIERVALHHIDRKGAALFRRLFPLLAGAVSAAAEQCGGEDRHPQEQCKKSFFHANTSKTYFSKSKRFE